MCGGQSYPFPYTDVSGVGAPFCPGIMEAYVTGVTKGTTPTTFSPNETVTRVQMTTFLQRSLDQGLTRANRRAALNQWWTTRSIGAARSLPIGGTPQFCASDGEVVWTTNLSQVVGFRTNGSIIGEWSGAISGEGLVVAGGSLYIAGETVPGTVYVLNTANGPGPVGIVSTSLGNNPIGIAFDGQDIWTANNGPPGSVSFFPVESPLLVTTVSTGFSAPWGIVYDGANIWVTDPGLNELLKLDSSGNILQAVSVGSSPTAPAFDGANIWVPNSFGDSLTVVQASTGNIVATISKNATNQLSGPISATFDGERVLVTNFDGDSVTVFKAADLSVINVVQTGTLTNGFGACSDGINFWVDLNGSGDLLRF
jgi:DNA-binding beta-propeller fold protein YncE